MNLSWVNVLWAGLILSNSPQVQGQERPGTQPSVALAGLAFAGDSATKLARFPLSVRYDHELSTTSQTSFARIAQQVRARPPSAFALTEGIDSLKARDQAIVTALVVTSETVSTEQFRALTKLLVQVRAQALFFDFESQTVLRAYPLAFTYLDTLDHTPSQAEAYERLRGVYEGAGGKPGLFERYAQALAQARLPGQVSRYLQVSAVSIEPGVLQVLPAALSTHEAAAQAWVADALSQALSSRTGVPLLPFFEGEAIGRTMAVQISDGDVYTLQVPAPDYPLTVHLSQVKKVLYGQSGAGTSYVYGAFAGLNLSEPTSGKVYLDTAVKNAEVKLVPATQTVVDDVPAFEDAITGLFEKFSQALADGDLKWLKAATTSADIEKQVLATRTLLKACQ